MYAELEIKPWIYRELEIKAAFHQSLTATGDGSHRNNERSKRMAFYDIGDRWSDTNHKTHNES